MGKSGLIIRLIDVAMIILFGFIAISDIKVRAQIKLPSEQDEQQPEPEQKPALLFIEIGLDKIVRMTQDDRILVETADLQQLETALVQTVENVQSEGRKAVVLIEPDEDSPIQFTVDVLDMCERHNIPKNINYESMQFR